LARADAGASGVGEAPRFRTVIVPPPSAAREGGYSTAMPPLYAAPPGVIVIPVPGSQSAMVPLVVPALPDDADYSLSDAMRDAAWRKATADRLRRLSYPKLRF